MDKDEIIRLMKENYNVLTDEYSVSKIGIFGSAAKGTMTEDSDLDIIVEFKKANRIQIYQTCGVS
ncbi:MAG: hypothetical protein E3K37_10975 [Candidatus Kuenenia sp.]|nr:hypothetical protein [Candidatus Kuenenia hertensis]